jgi:hypothetical protein
MNKCPLVVVILVLCIVVLLGLYQREHNKVVAMGVREGQVQTVALACSSGTKALETAAEQRHEQGAPKVAEAASKAKELQRQAQQIQSTPAAIPGDSCASADARIATWWQERTP